MHLAGRQSEGGHYSLWVAYRYRVMQSTQTVVRSEFPGVQLSDTVKGFEPRGVGYTS